MKLSIRLVTLLASLAAGSPAKVDKRQTDEVAKALKEYCGEAGFEAGDIKEFKEGYEAFTGACRKADGSNRDKFSVQGGVKFCEKLSRRFRGSAGPHRLGDYVVVCGPKEDIKQPDTNNGLVLLNQIIADSGNDLEKIKTFVMGLSRDAPGTLISIQNALKAAPSTTAGGLGGATGASAGLAAPIYDFIMINAAPGGLFGPETKVGQFLLTNPLYGRAGTQPSPFGFGGDGGITELPPTQKCVPFRDERHWYWTDDVKRCTYWHDRNPCDASYAYDAATDAGKELERVCDAERKINGLKPEEKNEAVRKEEDSCIRPKWACESFDEKSGKTKFEYCMDDTQSAKEVCKANGWTSSGGRDKNQGEKEDEKAEQLKKEEANCFSPRWTCRNIKGDFVSCINGDESSQQECKQNQWFPEPAPERKEA